MYARMLGVSNRLDALTRSDSADPDYLEAARVDLYKAQCNCPYWHGAFGGLYLPHLRNAVYRHLIAAHIALDEAEGLTGPRVTLEVGDFNLDARQEVRIENDRLIAFSAPPRGGTSTSSTSATRRSISWPPSTAAPRRTTGRSSPPRPTGKPTTARRASSTGWS